MKLSQEEWFNMGALEYEAQHAYGELDYALNSIDIHSDDDNITYNGEEIDDTLIQCDVVEPVIGDEADPDTHNVISDQKSDEDGGESQ